MEFLDVLTENGTRSGEIATRKEVHEKGLWHRIALVAVINSENKILMQQRSATCKKFPLLWDLAMASHVQSGEDSITTCVREINEEIGLQIEYKAQVKDFRFITSFRNHHEYDEVGGKHLIENQYYDLFVLRKDIDLSELTYNDGEVSDAKWVTYTEIQKLLNNNQLHPRVEWIPEIVRYINKF